eukprot:108480-Pyramimonas_sp.AAC.2
MAPLHGEPGPASPLLFGARRAIAMGAANLAEQRSSATCANLCVGARVMPSQMRSWGVGAVPLGLMNGVWEAV